MKKVVKFYATWCGPCRMYAKTWDKITPKYDGQVEFLNIDVENDPTGLSKKYQVSSIPMTVLIKEDGTEIKKTGRLSAEELEELILS